MQLAATGDSVLVQCFTLLNPERHVVKQLAVQSFLDVAGGEKFAFQSSEWRVIHLKSHTDGGLIDAQGRECLRMFRVTQGFGDLQFIDAGNADNVPRLCLINVDPLEPEMGLDLQNPALTGITKTIDNHHVLIGCSLTPGDTAYPDHSDVAAVVKSTDLHLKRLVYRH